MWASDLARCKTVLLKKSSVSVILIVDNTEMAVEKNAECLTEL